MPIVKVQIPTLFERRKSIVLVYKDGRFYAGRSSFALVNGYKLNDAPPALYRNGINLYTSDEACMIDVNF